MTNLETSESNSDEQPVASDAKAELLLDKHWQAETFEECDLSPELISQLVTMGWKAPTPVQGLCLPYVTKGRDLAGFAQTGTGKTGVFLLTFAHKFVSQPKSGKGPFCVILTPTRELAIQIESDSRTVFQGLGIRTMACFGGVNYEKQAAQIREGVDLIVATPGRLKDYFKKKILDLSACHTFVCDEADRMLDMGFIADVEFFLEKLSQDTQKLLFSATTNEQVKELAFEYLENPEYISVNPEIITPENIEQYGIICSSEHKLQVILGLLRQHDPVCSIIFTNTKIVAEWLHYKLSKNSLEVEIITGDLPQNKRINLIGKIKKGQVKALIATDVASRGLHIAGVTHVYNFDLPDDSANYVHRIGRTARAGAKGAAYSLVCEDYGHNLQAVQELLGEGVPIKTVWHDEEFLAIEDAAPNPYKDPEFKSHQFDNKGSRSEAPSRSKSRPTDSPSEGSPRGGNKDRKPRSKNIPAGRKKAAHGDKQPRQDRRPRSKAKVSERTSQKNPIAVQNSPSSLSIMGMVKKLFATIFGLKK